ncbi:hypothetical protein E0M25_21325 [Bacillus mycoides]|uniref:hypothetical protein n=1 Tax=Bacillus mycoides TaxID=1405 RepID=UPI00103EDBBD|nr:hypothetical protein [Bacillus mycoides]TBX73378.1 hypothetical protein E0M25_21325 [Bacillus mycoides]
MTTNKSLTINDPKTISYEVDENKIVMSFDGDKTLIIPIEQHSMHDIFNDMQNPSFAELREEWTEFETDKHNLQHAYNNACNECEAAEKNYKQVLIGDALGKNVGSDKNEAMTIQTNARNHVTGLEQAMGSFAFNSKYTPEQIKVSYEAAQERLLEHYRTTDSLFAKELTPLISLIVSQAETFNNALTHAEHVMTHDIYFKRGYEKNFTTQIVGRVPVK